MPGSPKLADGARIMQLVVLDQVVRVADGPGATINTSEPTKTKFSASTFSLWMPIMDRVNTLPRMFSPTSRPFGMIPFLVLSGISRAQREQPRTTNAGNESLRSGRTTTQASLGLGSTKPGGRLDRIRSLSACPQQNAPQPLNVTGITQGPYFRRWHY